MKNTQYDAVVVGSGPNGFAAAITLQKVGLSVLLIEGRNTVRDGMRTAELTLSDYTHTVRLQKEFIYVLPRSLRAEVYMGYVDTMLRNRY